ncbi:hypothetical protein E3226_006120 [Legionella geestiana]|uniref:alginate lyase family protein n=1 Tax=Legionella geestiana TaxID=45065 RepID=UPI00109203D4|nr:alginate lyase family protein [Legionella geestiana]QDQ40002.1 hypothetical protein E3226_006120 [Legionella geestiana]
MNLVRKALNKPLDVVIFRGLQRAKLTLNKISRKWPRVAARAERIACLHQHLLNPVVLCINPPTLSEMQLEILYRDAEAIQQSQFELFGHRVPNLDDADFSCDWRFNKRWENTWFQNYHFYHEKTVPYDVKFPWELSRFHYLIPVFAYQLYSTSNPEVLSWALSLLQRWKKQNPLAYSVNWYPMEASMRIINLVVLLDIVKIMRTKNDLPILEPLQRQLTEMLYDHAHFVWATREYTDVRGNHFSANLTALLLAARALPAARVSSRWESYAIRWLDKDITEQFLADGVNFEKSCGYHKLVLELFLLAAIAREKAGNPFTQERLQILRNAARYSDAITRPDGLAANFGDNDDACTLYFSIMNPRSHGPVIELARAFFREDIGSCIFPPECRLSAGFLLGRQHVVNATITTTELLPFTEGGYYIVRNQKTGFFCMLDAGEVGMRGRGGHGHNDLLAFELFVGGNPIVIDPGCPGYTADLHKKNTYRSTSCHSTLMLFDAEMARLQGYWSIANDAVPLRVKYRRAGDWIIIRAGHGGYERIANGTVVRRTLFINPRDSRLKVIDRVNLTASVPTPARWFFPTPENSPIPVASGMRIGDVTLSTSMPIVAVPSHYSEGYGQEAAGITLECSRTLNTGFNRMSFIFHQHGSTQ